MNIHIASKNFPNKDFKIIINNLITNGSLFETDIMHKIDRMEDTLLIIGRLDFDDKIK
jgi:hypothetical protein